MNKTIRNIFNVLFTLILFSNYVYTQTPGTPSGSTIQKVSTENRIGLVIDEKTPSITDRM